MGYTKPDKLLVATDVIIFTIKENDFKTLLVKRKYPPFEGMWAIPGGFVRKDEGLEDAAIRELREETGVHDVYLEQLYTFGNPARDPRDRVISVSYFALIDWKTLELKAATDAERVEWHSMSSIPQLAFDHKKILEYALQRLRYKLEYTTVGLELLPEKFTLTELQNVYETILEKKLDKRNFRKKIKSLDILKPLKEAKMEGAHRPAQLFKFKEKGQKYKRSII